MLYFIGMIAVFILYVVDRSTLCYFYKLPPMYTDRLTLFFLRFISKIPIVALCILFWQSNNQQMFDNKIDQIRYEDQVQLSHHKVFDLSWSKLYTA